ncbi:MULTISPECIES: glycosyltransferase family 2 protein [Pseudoalteromonas]|uniref:glycosyltransferase family 2 protein n=1 Tax=Pseudoalteromonas TaxID=53246 RepID=UPI0003179E98|nr:MULTISPECIES: glycosyltransferase [Pseudoalteromonas]MCF6145994.1 hypothetical protein [Pseudoalteromonas mariniglutinosa NCIMB 1770]
MKIKVSIIIPYYKSKKSLLKLVKSIPEVEGIEIIIIDDHSYDIDIKDIRHPCVQLLRQQKGKKWAGAARNLGMSISKGEYLLFADADDYFLPNAFNVILTCCAKNYDIVYFTPTSIKDNGEKSKRHTSYKELVDAYIEKQDVSIKYRYHVPWSKLIKKSLVVDNNITFDEVIASNDVNFSLKSSFYAKNIIALKDEIYCVVESDSSLTKLTTLEVSNSRFNAISRYNDFLISHEDSNLAAMSGHIWNARKFGMKLLLSRLFYSLKKGYKIFYDFQHIIKVIKREFKN